MRLRLRLSVPLAYLVLGYFCPVSSLAVWKAGRLRLKKEGATRRYCHYSVKWVK